MIQATQLRRGNAIVLNGQVFKVVDHKHITPGNWRGMVQTKLRNLQTGALIDHRFRSEDRVERAILDERAMQYLYSDGEHRYFMDTESFEQIHLSAQTLGDFIQYLTPDCSIRVEFFEGIPIGVELPQTVELQVVETEPGLPSATASSVLKPAKLETGLVVQVPHFVEAGQIIRVDTNEGTYIERVRG